MDNKVMVIFSGGQDSTACLAWAKNRYDEVFAITFNYGQNHSIEIEQSKIIAEKLGIEQYIIDVSFFGEIVDSALTHNGDVNKKHNTNTNLPASYVPNRNAFFITIAHAVAQKIGANTLVTGVCETDYSGYPDCRKVFVDSIEKSLNLGSDSNIKIETPLMYIDKADTFKLAEDEGVLDLVLKYSHTCYNGSDKMNEWGRGCGDCPACKLRKAGWEEYKKRYNK